MDEDEAHKRAKKRAEEMEVFCVHLCLPSLNNDRRDPRFDI